jgi:hypothetical protein
VTDEKLSFWSAVWAKTVAILKWIGLKLLAPGIVLILVIVAIVLVSMGFKELQIGGLIAKLLGKKAPEHNAIDVANTVSPDRVDKDGKIIPLGTPDATGQTQAVVVPIQEPGIFSNPDTIKFVPPGKTESVEIQLPDGVKAKDVSQVIVVQPDKFVVTVHDSSGISASKVDALLTKYN